MREMKDSGIEWIGKIPRDWIARRIKELFYEVRDRVLSEDDYELLSVSEYYGVAPRAEKVTDGEFITRAETLDGYKLCQKGDIVMNIMLAWKRALGESRYDGIVSPAYCVFRRKTNNVWPAYFHYLFRTDIYAQLFKQYSTGIIDSRLRLYPDKFFALKCQVPPLNEQVEIVNYLDTKCSQIDNIIAKQEQIIEKLKEYRLSLITETVTKGLNANEEMKDSGDKRIGSIPKAWNKIKITRILDYNQVYPLGDGDHGLIKTDDYKESGIPYIRVQNLGWGTDLLFDNIVFISDEDNEKIRSSELHPGDILFCKTGATIGKTGMIPDSVPVANTTSHVGKITIDKKYNARFVFYFLSSKIGYELFWDIACMKSTRPELSIEETRAINVVMPQDRSEQDKIVRLLDSKCKTINDSITKKYGIIEKLKEYKKSLIYEVVTGKKEV